MGIFKSYLCLVEVMGLVLLTRTKKALELIAGFEC